MKTASSIFFTIALLLVSFIGQAQEIAQPAIEAVEMADGMRSSGKIYVVVAVMTLLMVGVFTYLVLLDRKIRKLEKQTA